MIVGVAGSELIPDMVKGPLGGCAPIGMLCAPLTSGRGIEEEEGDCACVGV